MQFLSLLVAGGASVAAVTPVVFPQQKDCNHGTDGDTTCEKKFNLNTYCCRDTEGGEFTIPRLVWTESNNSQGKRTCGDGGKVSCCGTD
ncbi:hypothetical protein E4U43_004685 [Claviceps pusilla]|uniref:Uncharacterized protein n=1 Tax=Claviceps pusilla TaxID=123648 RepID=A0A9P7N5U2_9HYPO|nr:hypothetical protein E4U43_004685 [Claviceps pusilla]